MCSPGRPGLPVVPQEFEFEFYMSMYLVQGARVLVAVDGQGAGGILCVDLLNPMLQQRAQYRWHCVVYFSISFLFLHGSLSSSAVRVKSEPSRFCVHFAILPKVWNSISNIVSRDRKERLFRSISIRSGRHSCHSSGNLSGMTRVMQNEFI